MPHSSNTNIGKTKSRWPSTTQWVQSWPGTYEPLSQKQRGGGRGREGSREGEGRGRKREGERIMTTAKQNLRHSVTAHLSQLPSSRPGQERLDLFRRLKELQKVTVMGTQRASPLWLRLYSGLSAHWKRRDQCLDDGCGAALDPYQKSCFLQEMVIDRDSHLVKMQRLKDSGMLSSRSHMDHIFSP